MKERKTPWWFWRREDTASIPVKRDYTIISSVGGGLVGLLRDNMVPDVISGREEIGLCTPEERGDMTLGVYLYDVQENSQLRVGGMQPLDDRHLQLPPLYLSLHYMLTAYSDIDIRYREDEKHRIITRAMQVLYDHPVLDGNTLRPSGGSGSQDVHIEFLNLRLEEKMAVWQNIRQNYQLSLFYRVTPVCLDSTVRREISRVREIQLGADMENGG